MGWCGDADPLNRDAGNLTDGRRSSSSHGTEPVVGSLADLAIDSSPRGNVRRSLADTTTAIVDDQCFAATRPDIDPEPSDASGFHVRVTKHGVRNTIGNTILDRYSHVCYGRTSGTQMRSLDAGIVLDV